VKHSVVRRKVLSEWGLGIDANFPQGEQHNNARHTANECGCLLPA